MPAFLDLTRCFAVGCDFAAARANQTFPEKLRNIVEKTNSKNIRSICDKNLNLMENASKISKYSFEEIFLLTPIYDVCDIHSVKWL